MLVLDFLCTATGRYLCGCKDAISPISSTHKDKTLSVNIFHLNESRKRILARTKLSVIIVFQTFTAFQVTSMNAHFIQSS